MSIPMPVYYGTIRGWMASLLMENSIYSEKTKTFQNPKKLILAKRDYPRGY